MSTKTLLCVSYQRIELLINHPFPAQWDAADGGGRTREDNQGEDRLEDELGEDGREEDGQEDRPSRELTDLLRGLSNGRSVVTPAQG